jgi:hypothetical protein
MTTARLSGVLGLLAIAALVSACGGGGGGGAPGGNTSGGSGGSIDPPASGYAKVTWYAPTSRTDGSPLNDLDGFCIYYAKSQQDLSNRIVINNPSAITWTVTDLSRGTWYFAVTAYDQHGVESSYSDIASKAIP